MRWCLAVTLVLLAACTSSSVSGKGTAAPSQARATIVVCRAAADLDAAKLARAKQVLLARGDAVTGGHASIASTTPSSVAVALPGFDRSFATAFCQTKSLQFRPLLVPPQTLTCGASCDPAPLAKRAVPTSEAAVGALSAADRAALLAAVGRYACGSSTENTAAGFQLACADDGKAAYLLGPVILDNDAITAARPTQAAGQSTVTITLDAAGARTWTAWTTAHNSGGDTAGTIDQCGAAVPCADFVAFVFDGQILSAPIVISPITGSLTQITGNFTAASTRELAGQLAAGALPAVFHTASVSSR